MTLLKKSDQPVNSDRWGMLSLAASTKRSERSDQAFRYNRSHPALRPAAFRQVSSRASAAKLEIQPPAWLFPPGRKRKGQAVPRWGKNLLKWRIIPISKKSGVPDHLVTFQVMRRTLGTDMQEHGTLKDK